MKQVVQLFSLSLLLSALSQNSRGRAVNETFDTFTSGGNSNYSFGGFDIVNGLSEPDGE